MINLQQLNTSVAEDEREDEELDEEEEAEEGEYNQMVVMV